MVVEIIQKDISYNGIGYIILRDCPEERIAEGLDKGMEKLKRVGAVSVWATSLPEGEPLAPGPVGVWRLSRAQEIVSMTATLPLQKPDLKLNLRMVRRSADYVKFTELKNRGYVGTLDATVFLGSSAQNRRRTIAYRDNRLVACADIDFSEPLPELLSLAVDVDFRRQGIGRSLLRSVLDSVKAPACTVVVSAANRPALALLESEGFRQTGLVSEWFTVT